MKHLPPHLVEADTVSTAYSGMRAQRIRMNTIANNIANMHTTRGPNGEFAPFLRKEVLFKALDINPKKPYNQGVEIQEVLDAPNGLRRMYDPAHPEADETGYRMTPNVKLPLEMANMIEASRAYEANLRAMKVSGRALKQDVDILAQESATL
jgi:flagellar basal-body rod protein FlgC